MVRRHPGGYGSPSGEVPVYVVSVINYKGGVGKTTVTANLGAELANRGMKVLLIDLDPQASLTFCFFTRETGGRLRDERPSSTWIRPHCRGHTRGDPGRAGRSPPARPTRDPANGGRLDLIASHLGLIDVDLELARRCPRRRSAARTFRVRGVAGRWLARRGVRRLRRWS